MPLMPVLKLLRAWTFFSLMGMWSGEGLIVLSCAGLKEFLGYGIFIGKTGQVTGKLRQVGHPSPL